jgi:hypothetical protein
MPPVANLSGFPCFEVEFRKDATLVNPGDQQAAAQFVKDQALTDLFVFSHGWNNDMNDARALYRNFFAKVRDQRTNAGVDGRQFGVLAILWPSKKFADAELIPGGGAAGVDSGLPDEVLIEQIDRLKEGFSGEEGFFDKPDAAAILDQAKALVPQLEDDPDARQQFVKLVRSLVKQRPGDVEDANDDFFTLPKDQPLQRLKFPPEPQPFAVSASPAAGIGDTIRRGVGNFYSGMKAGAERLLNYTTYYQMKERAGLVGSNGVYAVIRAIQDKNQDVKVHLIGHSFGGRVVTAAALGPDGETPIKPSTMTLLQTAFSHYGFAENYDEEGTDGVFRPVTKEGRIAGPVLVTYTKNDQAVGIAYPIASRLAGQAGAAFGDANDFYGGIGRNGAQKTPECAPAGVLLDVNENYAFTNKKVFNLQADVIQNHSDICKDEVTYALLKAVATT